MPDINSLPPEILKDILTLIPTKFKKVTDVFAGLPVEDDFMSRVQGIPVVLVLSSVCRLWRQIVNENFPVWKKLGWASQFNKDLYGDKAKEFYEIFGKETSRFSGGVSYANIDVHYDGTLVISNNEDILFWPLMKKAMIYYKQNAHLVEEAVNYSGGEDLEPGATLLPQLTSPLEWLLLSFDRSYRNVWRQFYHSPDFHVISQNLESISLRVGKGDMDMTPLFNLQKLQDLTLSDFRSLTLTVDESSINSIVPKLTTLSLAATESITITFDDKEMTVVKLLWKLASREKNPLRLEELNLKYHGFWESTDAVGVFTKWMNTYGIPRLTTLGIPLSSKAKVAVIAKAIRECPKLDELTFYMDEKDLSRHVEARGKRFQSRSFEQMFRVLTEAITLSAVDDVTISLVGEPEEEYDNDAESADLDYASDYEEDFDDEYENDDDDDDNDPNNWKLEGDEIEVPKVVQKWFLNTSIDMMKRKKDLEVNVMGGLFWNGPNGEYMFMEPRDLLKLAKIK